MAKVCRYQRGKKKLLLKGTPVTKRTTEVLSPPDSLCEKKSKMATSDDMAKKKTSCISTGGLKKPMSLNGHSFAMNFQVVCREMVNDAIEMSKRGASYGTLG